LLKEPLPRELPREFVAERHKENIMAEQMRPASKKAAPDPADAYERSHPEHEAGMGRLDNNTEATPTCCPDKMHQAVKNRQDGGRQLNGGDAINQRGGPTAEQPGQTDHSMFDETPTDPDTALEDNGPANTKRNPRTGGKGGTPDAGDPNRNG